MGNPANISEADILDELVRPDAPTFSHEVARSLLDIRFSDKAKQRMKRLLDRNNKGVLTAVEQDALDKYRRVGLLVDLLQAKAHVSLKHANKAT